MEESSGVVQYSWEEVSTHCKRGDQWIVLNGSVYNVTQWSKKHPGGSSLLSHYSGQDATEAFKAFHKNLNYVAKYMKPLYIGELDSVSKEHTDRQSIKKDFEDLRITAQKAGYFKASGFFFALTIAHIILFDVVGYLIMYTYGTSWLPYLATLACVVISVVQAGWTQHDFGHLSVFNSMRWNKIFHTATINLMKGAATTWWNHLHYRHHSKPNVIGKDPDVRLENVFVLSDTMAKSVAKKKNSMPYNWQHYYFFATLPPLLFPVYFQITIFRHVITRKEWLDLFFMLLFYIKFFVLYTPLLGIIGAVKLYFLVRCVESHWFVWVTQMNHIPMQIEEDKALPWLQLQLAATCNVERSLFNDWFTGHLNFQIEHHLFPTMPRHNLYKVQPLVKSLCKKHHVPYYEKSLLGAFRDIVKSLKTCGELWHAYYDSYHLQSS